MIGYEYDGKGYAINKVQTEVKVRLDIMHKANRLTCLFVISIYDGKMG
jgi:hypothetical protein